jgi:hypothetical protein
MSSHYTSIKKLNSQLKEEYIVQRPHAADSSVPVRINRIDDPYPASHLIAICIPAAHATLNPNQVHGTLVRKPQESTETQSPSAEAKAG